MRSKNNVKIKNHIKSVLESIKKRNRDIFPCRPSQYHQNVRVFLG